MWENSRSVRRCGAVAVCRVRRRESHPHCAQRERGGSLLEVLPRGPWPAGSKMETDGWGVGSRLGESVSVSRVRAYDYVR
jgi:hypothetical protein